MRGLMKFAGYAAVLALVLLGARVVHDLTHHVVSPVQAVASHPMPTMFPDSAMAPYTGPADAQAAKAATLMKAWWSAHGTQPRDKQFLAWLKQQAPTAPSAASRRAEAAQVEKLVKGRTATGKSAAQWLRQYGRDDLWLFYEHQQAAHASTQDARDARKQLARLVKDGTRFGTSLNKKLHQPAPFLIDPALRPAGSPAGGSTTHGCPCSYPVAADVASSAASTFLAGLHPQQAALYRHMADEEAFAGMYLGGRLPSDSATGRLLGDMLGEYFLVTRHHGSPDQVTATLAAAGSSPARSAGAAGSSAGSTSARG
jgi:hypothetical protein